MTRQMIIVLAGLFLMSGLAAAEVVALAPSQDVTLYEDSAGAPGTGPGNGLFVGPNAEGGFARRAVLAFDLIGRIPPGSQIHSAVLTLHMAKAGTESQIVYLHRMLAPWGESPSPATWIQNFPPDRAWAQPGGDYDPAVSTACEVNDVGFYTWGPVARMTQDVQQWVDNPASNFGWILIGQEPAPEIGKRFNSRECADTLHRPTLTIHFTRLAGYLPPVEGDLNGDRQVDFQDISLMASQWLAGADEPAPIGAIAITGVGGFTFDLNQVQTLRPDIFQPGRFSAFDVLVHLDENGLIDMAYHFDETMDTHVIDSINGIENWWYRAHYSGGKLIDLVTRMDLYPCKDKMEISIETIDKARLDQIYASFASEVARKAADGGQIVIPEVTILGNTFQHTFTDVVVRPHNLRLDTFREGVVTAMDVVLTLADEGRLTCDLRWYDSIGAARVVRSFYLKRIDADAGTERSGFQYETGADKSFGKANRISMPSDWRVLVSPIYMQWDWVSLE